MENVAEKEVVLDSSTYKCKSCGNFLSYNPDENKLYCEHCQSLFDLQKVNKAVEIPYDHNSEIGYEDWGCEKNLKCTSCGAVTTLNSFETTINCPFCNAPNIVEVDDLKGLKPNGILPFKISRKKAVINFKAWLKRKFFAPQNLAKTAETKELKGVYVPLFTFDTDTETDYDIRYGKYYYVVVGSGKNRRSERRTQWYTDSGYVENRFDDIQIEASQFMTQKDFEKLGGFDTYNALEYHNQFITGYTSERYNCGLDASWESAKIIADKIIVQRIKNSYNADVIDYCDTSNKYKNNTYKYNLVPMWFMNYKYNNKNYKCSINGRTGKVIGKTPLSKIKVGITALLASGIVAAVVVLILKYVLHII